MADGAPEQSGQFGVSHEISTGSLTVRETSDCDSGSQGAVALMVRRDCRNTRLGECAPQHGQEGFLGSDAFDVVFEMVSIKTRRAASSVSGRKECSSKEVASAPA